MDVSWRDLEGIAREALERAGMDDVVDVRELARAIGVDVVEAPGRVGSTGRLVFVRPGEPRRQKWLIAHELGHVLARRAGLDPGCERTANGIANCLIIPDAAAKRDLSRYDWEVAPIRARHELSWEATLRRLVTVTSAVGALWRGGRLVWWGRSPWLRNRLRAGALADLPRQDAGSGELALVPPETAEAPSAALGERL